MENRHKNCSAVVFLRNEHGHRGQVPRGGDRQALFSPAMSANKRRRTGTIAITNKLWDERWRARDAQSVDGRYEKRRKLR